MASLWTNDSRIRVKTVGLDGPGVVILTGPSSCGKGEVAAALCDVLSIDPHLHLSMGEILRSAFRLAKSDVGYATLLSEKYQISANTDIAKSIDANDDLLRKVKNYRKDMEDYFKRSMETVTQLEWLEFCTMQGLLVPNRWTQEFIAAHIEHNVELREKPFILDGYPRTVTAAQHLLNCLERMQIPIIKVLHMSISKQEMISRANKRGRADDDEASLLSRYNFYVENVQPSVDFMKMELGAEAIALIDAHQPIFDEKNGAKAFNLEASIANVVGSSLRALGAQRNIVRDVLDLRRRGAFRR